MIVVFLGLTCFTEALHLLHHCLSRCPKHQSHLSTQLSEGPPHLGFFPGHIARLILQFLEFEPECQCLSISSRLVSLPDRRRSAGQGR